MKATERADRADGKKWVVRWREGRPGEEVRRSKAFTLKRDATDFIREFERRRIYGLPSIDAGRVTLAEFVEEWWRMYAVPNLAPRTLDVYGHIWELHMRQRLGGYELRAITPEVVEDFRIQLQDRKVGDPTIIKAMGLLQGILKRAVVRGHIAMNPVLVVDKPKQRSSRRIQPFAPVSIEAIRSHMPAARDRLLVSLMGYQGLRPDEATRVKVSDIGARSLYVFARKTDRPRTVDLLAPVEQEIREYLLATGIRDGLLFPRSSGGEWKDHDWRNWRRRIYQGTDEAPGAARKAGVTGDMRPYRLRGSFVSLLLWEGRSVTYVAAQAGHDVATLAAHYAGVLTELEGQPQVSAVEAIAAAREQVGAQGAQLRLVEGR